MPLIICEQEATFSLWATKLCSQSCQDLGTPVGSDLGRELQFPGKMSKERDCRPAAGAPSLGQPQASTGSLRFRAGAGWTPGGSVTHRGDSACGAPASAGPGWQRLAGCGVAARWEGYKQAVAVAQAPGAGRGTSSVPSFQGESVPPAGAWWGKGDNPQEQKRARRSGLAACPRRPGAMRPERGARSGRGAGPGRQR